MMEVVSRRTLHYIHYTLSTVIDMGEDLMCVTILLLIYTYTYTDATQAVHSIYTIDLATAKLINIYIRMTCM